MPELKHTTTVVLPGRPVPWKRARSNGSRRFTDPEYATWKNEYQWAARIAHGSTPWVVPVVAVLMVAPDGVWSQFTPPEYFAGVQFPYLHDRVKHMRKSDLDNHQKAVGDSAQGIVFKDDRQIIAWYASFIGSIHDVLGIPDSGFDTTNGGDGRE